MGVLAVGSCCAYISWQRTNRGVGHVYTSDPASMSAAHGTGDGWAQKQRVTMAGNERTAPLRGMPCAGGSQMLPHCYH